MMGIFNKGTISHLKCLTAQRLNVTLLQHPSLVWLGSTDVVKKATNICTLGRVVVS